MISAEKIDLHIHSTASDGSDAPEKILEHVKKEKIGVFSVTDHDTIKACAIIRGMLKEGDPAFICGAEFSCEDELGRYHILAYYDDPEAPSINALAEEGHVMRMKKIKMRIDFLEKEFGFKFPPKDVEKLNFLDNPGKPHIGKMMVKLGYADSINSAIEDYINLLKIPESHLRPEYVIKGILNDGGIPVLAHPFFGDGSQLIVGNDMEERIKRLIGFGIQGVETYYSGFTPKLIDEMLKLAEKYNLYVTAGSDYHGVNKMVRLGDNGLEGAGEYPAGLIRFLNKFGIEI